MELNIRKSYSLRDLVPKRRELNGKSGNLKIRKYTNTNHKTLKNENRRKNSIQVYRYRCVDRGVWIKSQITLSTGVLLLTGWKQ